MAPAPGAATTITSNVLGARTDLELRNILTERRNETVCIGPAHGVQPLRSTGGLKPSRPGPPAARPQCCQHDTVQRCCCAGGGRLRVCVLQPLQGDAAALPDG